jgi:hypothetical protein
MMQIIRCPSCDGYGWIDEDEQALDCDWCAGVGYVYRDESGVDRRIPQADLPGLTDTLERLEQERMRDLGYTGSPKHPREQDIRRKP